MTNSRRFAGLAVVLLGASAFGSVSRAADQLHTINFHDAQISQIVSAVSKATNTKFVMDPRLHAVVSLESSKPVSSAAFYVAFMNVLHQNHFVAVPMGGVMRIMAEADLITD